MLWACALVAVTAAAGEPPCLDLRTGRPIWRRDLAADSAADEGFFGVAASPVVFGKLLIVAAGGSGGPCVAALDKLTGETRWSAEKQWSAGQATPLVARIAGRDVVLVFAGGADRPPSGGLVGLDANDGTVRFRMPWRSTRYHSVNASSPVAGDGLVFVSSSYDIGGLAVRLRPDLSAQPAWKCPEFGSHWATPILHEGRLYGFAENVLMCVDWKTGRPLWKHGDPWPPAGAAAPAAPAEPAMRLGRASLIQVRDRFLCLGDSGWLCWMTLDAKGPRLDSRARLFQARLTYTAPALSRGLLYIVQSQRDPASGKGPRLLCYDLRE